MTTLISCSALSVFVIVVLLDFLKQTTSRSSSSSFRKLHSLKKSADLIDSLHVLTVGECAVRCIARHDCNAYNYFAQTYGESNKRVCELLKGGNNSMVSAASDWDMFVGKCILP